MPGTANKRKAGAASVNSKRKKEESMTMNANIEKQTPVNKKALKREEANNVGASEENVLPDVNEAGKEEPKVQVPTKPFVGTFRMFEKHKTTLYGCAFNQFLHPPEVPTAAAVGGTRVHLYKFSPYAPYGNNHIIDYKDVNLEFKEAEDLYSVAWCQIGPDEYRIVFGGETGRLYVMDDRTMKITKNIIANGGAINDIRTCPTNSRLFATASKDKSIRVFDIRATAYLLVFGGLDSHLDSVLTVDWTPDGNKILSCGFDHYVNGWDLSAKEVQDHLTYCTKYLDENRPIKKISDPEGYTKQFHKPSNMIRQIHHDYVDCIRTVPGGKETYFITKGCGRESLLRFWRFGTYGSVTENSITGQPLISHTLIFTKKCTSASLWFNKFAIDPKHEFIVAGGDSGDLHFFNFDKKEDPIYTVKLNSRKEMTRQVAFSNDGKIILAVGQKGLICRLDRVPKESPINQNSWRRL
ncbi:hypothetical protein CAEBREN_28826 [Caenorhabditis brenneri]|uniref:Uncharacterized protein n=1 Tax=Caenorhabditis brenneri TaxID=135651 RepID=G0P8Z5_CAEBE|nr:hypothetical protein CAEBREN_28826 [Caenorhabditis brenneri]